MGNKTGKVMGKLQCASINKLSDLYKFKWNGGAAQITGSELYFRNLNLAFVKKDGL